MLGIAGMCSIVYRHSKSGICVLLLQYLLNLSLIGLSVSQAEEIYLRYDLCNYLFFKNSRFYVFYETIKKTSTI